MKLKRILIGVLACSVVPCAVHAHDFPSRPVTWVVPFAPGGVTDASVRVVAKALGETLGTPVIVDNRAGAGGIVGTEYVARSKPDGYTILFGGTGPLLTNQYVYKKLSYDPIKSFSPIHSFFESPLIMVVNANAPYKTIGEFVDFAKKNPGRINFGSPGAGTTPHLASQLLQMDADIKLTHVPYKGSAPAMADLLAGLLDVSFDYSAVVKPMIDAGKLRAIAVTGNDRMKNFANVPTLKEAGYSRSVISAWSIIVSAANTPQPIVTQLAEAFDRTLRKPEVAEFFEKNGSMVMQPLSGAKLTDFLLDENSKIKAVVERSGLKAE